MSYCRWSDMSCRCEVYAYECADDAVRILVNTLRLMPPDDFPDSPHQQLIDGEITGEEFPIFMDAYSEALYACPTKPIGLSRDGLCKQLPHKEAADLIVSLREEGYIIPEGLEDTIREDGDLQ